MPEAPSLKMLELRADLSIESKLDQLLADQAAANAAGGGAAPARSGRGATAVGGPRGRRCRNSDGRLG